MIAENNIYNIRYEKRNRWLGQVGQRRGFVCFDTRDHGIRACFVLLVNYIRFGHDTYRKIINRFAPPTENDTNSYLNFVCSPLFKGLDSFDPDSEVRTYHDLFVLMLRMAEFENNVDLFISDIENAVQGSSFNDSMLFNNIKLI